MAWTSVSSPARSRSASDAFDVLEVDVTDAICVIADELHRVDAADQQVAGIEAPGDVGVRERPLDVVRGLDERADVGVQHERQPFGGDEVGELAQLRRRRAASRRRRAATGADHVVVLHQRGDEDVGARGGELRGRAASVLVGELARARRPARTRRPAAGRSGRARRATAAPSSGSQPCGPSSVALQAQLGHLGQHPLGRELQAPARDLADAPRDRALPPSGVRDRRSRL